MFLCTLNSRSSMLAVGSSVVPSSLKEKALKITYKSIKKKKKKKSLTNFVIFETFHSKTTLWSQCPNSKVQNTQATGKLSTFLFPQKLLWDKLIKNNYHFLLQSSIHSFMMAWYVSRSMEMSFCSGSSMLHSSSRPLSSDPRLVVCLR